MEAVALEVRFNRGGEGMEEARVTLGSGSQSGPLVLSFFLIQ